MVILLTGCYVYYAAGSFTVWYVVLRGACTVGWNIHGRTVICTMYAAACSISVVVYSALLYVATACLLRPCWEKVLSSPKLGWVVVILSVGRGIGRGWVVGLFIFMGFGVSAGHQRFCWGLC